jgi:predicted glycogen debranching enzyme
VTIAAAEGHEFGDWGRDTMISLEGLMLCTKRFREARATLQTFAGYVSDGLIPNLFPEGEREGLYHTVDATLWYFHAVHRYMRATLDASLLDELLPVLRSIVDYYVRGTRFGIKMDPNDGLIAASAAGYQLTWMDAKVDNWVVTPRRGKPVEIQALWYNALRLMANWIPADERTQYERLAAQVNASFNRRYWNDARGCLFDVLDGPDGPDAAVRPNQVFAISLDYPVLAPARWNAVIACIEQNLLTPVGLRTLSRDHPDYKSSYNGDLRARDAAYHQGTVWPWLIGHFIDAKLKVVQDKASVRELLRAFPAHLAEAGIGTISEIFDGDLPHAPHGCIAQAWSVAEVLRAWMNTSTSSTKLHSQY